MAKELQCNDIMPGCDYVARGETEDEIMAQGAQHAREVHGIDQLDEATAQRVRSSIRDI